LLPAWLIWSVAAAVAAAIAAGAPGRAGERVPRAALVPASTLRLPGAVDSNSPAVWDDVNGRPRLFVVTSADGQPSVARGPGLARIGPARPVELDPWPGGGVWIEAIVRDPDDGAWYGYYHNEISADDVCPGSDKVMPRIGAAVSYDEGQTWEQLGIILAAPAASSSCATSDEFFVNGVGDFSVLPDAESKYLYFFVSQYERPTRQQGVAVARLPWEDRADPVGELELWNGSRWVAAGHEIQAQSDEQWAYSAGSPIFPTKDGWHDANSTTDAFWGPSVSWNSYLDEYVMLLNRAESTNYESDGIYVSFAPRLDDPGLWSTPTKIVDGGGWYPEVIGTDPGVGTDKLAGETARFYVGGVSDSVIQFSK
jgi:hypothetical protein